MCNDIKNKAALWLALNFIPRLCIEKKLKLVEAVGLNKLFYAPDLLKPFKLTHKQLAAINHPDWEKIAAIIDKSNACQSDIIYYDHPHYPQRLKEIADPPLVLFVKGNCQCLNACQVAVVGSRNATSAAREIAQSFSQELSLQGITITSGLASGVDGYAHLGAHNQKGATIAVVATGLDLIYPRKHKQLQQNIIDNGGCIVSEFMPGTPPRAGNFPKRNRIISGMSIGVLVVEAALKSGSLITARLALEQNREVFAIPGSIRNVQAAGCHWLIKQGAKLVECCADIIEELDSSIYSGLHLTSTLTTSQKDIKGKIEKQDLFIDGLLASVDYEITPVDVVVSRSKLSTREVLTQLTMLELKGLVAAVPGGYLRL